MVIEIDAVDTLFFRDGKPFSMGDETWADGMFPPNPTVIRGALRSLWFSRNPQAFQNFKKDGVDPTKDLSIKGIAIRRRVNGFVEDLLPAPRDLVITNPDSKQAEFLSIEEYPDSAASSLSLKSYFTYKDDKKVNSIESAFLEKQSFMRYLALQGKFQITSVEDIITSEPKVGIGRNNTSLTAEEGQLYRVDMKRLQTVGGQDASCISLLVDYDNFDLPETGFFKLGGEGKVVSYRKAEPFLPDPRISLNEDNCFKLVLLTPAIFENGWKAKWMEDSTAMKERLGDLKIELVAAAIGGKQAVSGFDMKTRKDKETKYAVPAGSVYVLKILNENLDKAVEEKLRKAFKSPVSDDTEYIKQGFGVAVIGGAQ